ncbi:class I SAM-dependent methyltransferase [Streptomyces sp. B6B3]|uniref:class I SAM-dependent methyltransferase n=1 Tax=Streptomyces sp. B6B3 TaxID=3153570 RepID=UPI00325D4248
MSLVRRTVAPVVRPVIRRLDRHLEARMAGRDRRLAETRERAERTESALREELADTRKELRELRDRVHGLDLLLGREGRRVHRQPTVRQIGALARDVAEVTGARGADARREIVQAYRTLVEVENRGVGRIAGGTGNILGKLATVPLLDPPNGEVLEIGTLFGLFAGCLARQVVRAGLPYHLTIVDPISPVQLQEGRRLKHDLSGTPISEDVVRANLHYAGVQPERLRLVRGYSTAPEVRAALAGGGFGVIVVDGDHSAEGVAADLAWVEELAAPGAVVVLDDYGDPKWPGVREAGEAHLARPGTRLSLVGQVTTSAFLRAG